jgi:hypothetical protein
MTRSKKIFVGFVILFVILIGYASYDISSRTTFPGSKSQLPTRIERTFGSSKDSVKISTYDSVKNLDAKLE